MLLQVTLAVKDVAMSLYLILVKRNNKYYETDANIFTLEVLLLFDIGYSSFIL